METELLSRLMARALLNTARNAVAVLSDVHAHSPEHTQPWNALTFVSAESVAADGVKRRKKRNRWGEAEENKAANLMGLPTAIMANMTSEQLEAYTLHLRIEEISQKLRINDIVPADGDRSPSPPPQYDNFGRRINTREYRYRKRYEDERHRLIEKAMKIIPNYHPPSDYRRPTKTQEKVYVPVNDYPEINFSMLANPLTFLTFLTSPLSLSFALFRGFPRPTTFFLALTSKHP